MSTPPAGSTRLEHLARQAEALREPLEQLSATIHTHPETAFQERFACATLVEHLAAAGFEARPGAGGLETAFVASAGSAQTGDGQGPHIGMLLEYDALPGIGHACGHNLIAAGGVAAATLVANNLPAGSRLSVIGTPAEEGGGGKVKLLDAGVFDGLDAVLMFHPGDRTLAWRHSIAAAHLRIQFRGLATHAAKSPQLGRSALSGLTLFFNAVDALRQFIPERARIHGVIRQGGRAPNVVPDFAEADFFVRDITAERTLALVERVEACASGAAMCSGTTATVAQTSPLYTERKNNHLMAERLGSYLEAQGVHVEPPSFANPVGSSDVGNVSLRLPAIQPYLQIADRGTPSHSELFRDAALTPRAHGVALKMAVALAATGLDLLSDSTFMEHVQHEFQTHGPDIPPDDDYAA